MELGTSLMWNAFGTRMHGIGNEYEIGKSKSPYISPHIRVNPRRRTLDVHIRPQRYTLHYYDHCGGGVPLMLESLRFNKFSIFDVVNEARKLSPLTRFLRRKSGGITRWGNRGKEEQVTNGVYPIKNSTFIF